MKIKLTPMIIFRILFILAVTICVFSVFKLYSMISILFASMFPFVILFTALGIKSNKKIDTNLIVLIFITAIALINSIITLFLSETSVELSDFNKVIIFITTIMFLFTAARVKIDDDSANLVESLISIVSIILIIFFILKQDELYVRFISGLELLFFNFDNPNFASMYFLVFGIYNSIFAIKSKKKMQKIFYWIVALFMAFFVIETMSRNTMLVGLGFIIILIITKFRKKRFFYYNKALSFFLALFPLLFVSLYMTFLSVLSKTSFLSVIVEEGKQFDSRYSVWLSAFEKIKKSPLFGDYATSLSGQSHNTHIDIWVSYGVVVLFLTIIFITLLIYNKGYIYKDRISFLYMTGFVCSILIGVAEAALFAGCQGLYVIVGAFLLLSRAENSVEQNNTF